jgi:hypothetical protein
VTAPSPLSCGLIPRIQVCLPFGVPQDVDGRNKPAMTIEAVLSSRKIS